MSNDLLKRLGSLPNHFPGIDNLESEILNLIACRVFEQFCSTVRSLVNPLNYCPFCLRERSRRRRQALIFAGGWMLIENEFPHPGTEKMLLIIPKRHLTNPQQMDLDDWNRMSALFDHAQLHFGIPDGVLFLRFGDPKYNTSSIEHLHFNVIRPTPQSGYSPPATKTEEQYRKGYERLLTFCLEMKNRGGPEWLMSEKGIAETQPKL